MTRNYREFVVLALAAGLIAGCGGGSGGSGSGGGGNGGGGGGGSQNPTTVTFTVAGVTPTVIATQVGTGSFTTVTASSGKVTLSVPAGTTNFAVAWVCPGSNEGGYTRNSQQMIEASTKDGTSFGIACQGSSGSSGALTESVDISGIPGATRSTIFASNGSWFATGLGSSSSSSMTAPAGTDRVAVAAYGVSGQTGSSTLLAIRNFDNQPVPGTLNGGNPVVLGTSDEVTQEPITYQNVPPGWSTPGAFSTYTWADGGVITLGYSGSQYPALPATATETGDSYLIWAYSGSTANPEQAANLWTAFTTGGPVTMSFPAPWSYSGPTPAARPSFDLTYSGFAGTGSVYREVGAQWSPASTTQNQWLLFVSANYLNGSTTVTFPDLSGISGFLAAPASGTSVAWGAQMAQASFPAWQSVPANQTLTTVSDGGTYTVP